MKSDNFNHLLSRNLQSELTRHSKYKPARIIVITSSKGNNVLPMHPCAVKTARSTLERRKNIQNRAGYRRETGYIYFPSLYRTIEKKKELPHLGEVMALT